ncbi:MAG TPA: Stp1/IreP family PP2C-type Ser/Thr phosphatase [Solirubrobacteraceae bacterium]|nr:Stp1/IreP family PP2C-type Ser/Thr phosphatase [Solirubrobacteraceae bacterium]
MIRVAEKFARSETGRVRRANEDSLFAREPVFVVADGMGGARAGEVASKLAVDTFEPGLGDEGTPEDRLEAAAHAANARIHELARSDQQRAGMGTTLTAVYVDESSVALAHVGDSRAYLMRDSKLQRLTHDHSLVEELKRKGQLTEAEAAEHPQRSIITRALGPEAEVEVDRATVQARDRDIFLLCSDGLTGMVSEEDIANLITGSESLEQAGHKLIDAANAAGGRDNVSVVLFRVEDVPSSAAQDAEQSTVVGEPAPSPEQVSAAVERAQATGKAPAPSPAPAPATTPRRREPRPAPAAPAPGKRRRRVPTGLLAALTVVALVLVGGWFASRAVFFVGTSKNGAVTIFRGLPYELPGGLNLYERFYTSPVPATDVPASRRTKLLDQTLRSRSDASNLVRALELGKLAR